LFTLQNFLFKVLSPLVSNLGYVLAICNITLNGLMNKEAAVNYSKTLNGYY